jgi:hypothetical protein
VLNRLSKMLKIAFLTMVTTVRTMKLPNKGLETAVWGGGSGTSRVLSQMASICMRTNGEYTGLGMI